MDKVSCRSSVVLVLILALVYTMSTNKSAERWIVPVPWQLDPDQMQELHDTFKAELSAVTGSKDPFKTHPASELEASVRTNLLARFALNVTAMGPGPGTHHLGRFSTTGFPKEFEQWIVAASPSPPLRDLHTAAINEATHSMIHRPSPATPWDPLVATWEIPPTYSQIVHREEVPRAKWAWPGEGLAQTTSGVAAGVVFKESVAWTGIPFAAPPTGELRYAAPQPAPAWEGELDASQWGPGCPQWCTLPWEVCPVTMSENCLTINVYIPRAARKAPGAAGGFAEAAVSPDTGKTGFPVLLFVHGGSFKLGAAGSPVLAGQDWAENTNTILVSANYRLGTLGMTWAPPHVHGNRHLQDQRLFMQWTKDNIAAFGGNPDRITVAGESAGAASIAAHMSSPLSKGLFDAALLSSIPLGIPYKEPYAAARTTKRVVDRVGCAGGLDDIECMREARVGSLMVGQAATKSMVWYSMWDGCMEFNPVVGGGPDPEKELPIQPYDHFLGLDAAGNDDPGALWMNETARDIPVILGSVPDEGLMFVGHMFPAPVPKFTIGAAVMRFFGLGSKAWDMAGTYMGLADDLPALMNNPVDGRSGLSRLFTDILFNCGTETVAAAYSARRALDPSYPELYYYSVVAPITDDLVWEPNYWLCKQPGATCHGADLMLMFSGDEHRQAGERRFDTPGEIAAEGEFMTRFKQFLLDGSPNPASSPVWGPFSEGYYEFSILKDSAMHPFSDYGSVCKHELPDWAVEALSTGGDHE